MSAHALTYSIEQKTNTTTTNWSDLGLIIGNTDGYALEEHIQELTM